jgi:membrane protease YdiL (CAAX protease family)
VRGIAGWTASVVALLLATHVITTAVGVAMGHATVAWPFPSAGAFLLVLLFSPLTDPGGMEELGWRGWLQPALQTWIAPLPAAVVVGVIWGLWHLPVLVIPEFPQHNPDIALWLSVTQFTVQTTALAVILAVLLDATRGAVLPAFIAHWAVNLPWAMGLTEGTMTAWTAGVVVLAVALGWFRRNCLRSSTAVTLPARPCLIKRNRKDPLRLPPGRRQQHQHDETGRKQREIGHDAK